MCSTKLLLTEWQSVHHLLYSDCPCGMHSWGGWQRYWCHLGAMFRSWGWYFERFEKFPLTSRWENFCDWRWMRLFGYYNVVVVSELLLFHDVAYFLTRVLFWLNKIALYLPLGMREWHEILKMEICLWSWMKRTILRNILLRIALFKNVQCYSKQF